jgi:hypothetical protein
MKVYVSEAEAVKMIQVFERLGELNTLFPNIVPELTEEEVKIILNLAQQFNLETDFIKKEFTVNNRVYEWNYYEMVQHMGLEDEPTEAQALWEAQEYPIPPEYYEQWHDIVSPFSDPLCDECKDGERCQRKCSEKDQPE